jgi:hypothetical protein
MMTMVNGWRTRSRMTKISKMAMVTEIGERTMIMIAMQAMGNGGVKNVHIMLMAMVNGNEDCGEDIDDVFSAVNSLTA